MVFSFYYQNSFMRFNLLILIFFTSLGISAQQKEIDWEAADSLYREDQFYFSFSYNLLSNTPKGFDQNKFSPGISFGFLRDMPVNKNRTLAIAAGLGYTHAAYNQNLIINEANGSTTYMISDEETPYSKNKLFFHYVDLPIEFRWRTSTPESHKFWRIYTGFKISYLFYDKYKLVNSNGTSIMTKNDDFNKIQYGTYIAIGWNTWNFFTYYGLNPLFNSSAKINNESIDMNTVNFGLQFYIL
jgi:hypothetical protein